MSLSRHWTPSIALSCVATHKVEGIRRAGCVVPRMVAPFSEGTNSRHQEETAEMRIPIRPLLASVLVGATLAIGSGVTAHSRATAYSPKVYIYDNDGAFQGGDPGTGEWGYYPGHIDVYQGEQIEFDSPANNRLPHTVTSITWSGMPPNRTLTP